MKDFKKLDMQKHLKETLHSSTIPVIGDPPSLLNTKCANWTDVVVVDGKCYDKDAVAKLLAERDALLETLAQKQQLITEMDQLCLTVAEVNEIRAEAIADAVNAHPEKVAYVEHYAQTNSKGMHCDLWLSSSDLINYANLIRQGGDV